MINKTCTKNPIEKSVGFFCYRCIEHAIDIHQFVLVKIGKQLKKY